LTATEPNLGVCRGSPGIEADWRRGADCAFGGVAAGGTRCWVAGDLL